MPRPPSLEAYAARVGYAPSEIALLAAGDPRARHIERLSRAASQWSIVAEVIQARHCNAGYKPGDRFVLDVDGNFIAKLCPPRLCVYAMAQLVVPVALINERLSEGLEPNAFHFMRQVSCPDVGVGCEGYGEMKMRVGVRPRREVAA